jgi:dynein heavy chain 1
MNVRWEHFLNSYDTRAVSPYLPGSAGDSHSSNKNALFVREFASIVSTFSDRTDTLIDVYNETIKTIGQLSTCPYYAASFSTLLSSVQKTIDQLNLEGYANLDAWVQQLDEKIETVLIERLETVINLWNEEFAKDGESGNRDGGRNKLDSSVQVRSPACSSIPFAR